MNEGQKYPGDIQAAQRIEAARRYPAIAAGCQHAEAFNLMWYRCKTCGHAERYWNSRDGVTPFGTSCPSCGGNSLMHDAWHLDTYAPNHVPHSGQRVWKDCTEKDLKRWLAQVVKSSNRPIDEKEQEMIYAHYKKRYLELKHPAEHITGYHQE